MLAASTFAGLCFRRINAHLTASGPEIFLRHVQHVSSAPRPSIAPADSLTTPARLRPNDRPEKQSAPPRSEVSLGDIRVKLPSVQGHVNKTRKELATDSSTGTLHRPSIERGNRMGTTLDEQYDSLIVEEALYGTNALYAHLRNPKGTRTAPRTEPRSESTKESAMASQRPSNKRGRKRRDPPFYRAIRDASIQDIEEKLADMARHDPNVDGIQFMLQELLEVRHIEPQARHYEALILSNCCPRHGSASALYPILTEMEGERIAIGASTLSAVLKVLCIHPDAQLLSTTLSTMSSQWITPTNSDTTHTILALTRLNQFELAIPRLEDLISNSPPPDNNLHSPIPPFLYTAILYRLSSPTVADHTATLHLLYLLTDNNLPISNICMSYLLDSAAEALHLDLTLHIWRSHIDTEYIIPSTGLSRNALLTAARSGNEELALKAGRWLEFRQKLTLVELEMIRDALLADPDAREKREEVRRKRKRQLSPEERARAVARLQKRIGRLTKTPDG